MTHDVFNQVPPLAGHDLADDPALLGGLEREGAGWAVPEVHELGVLAGTERAQETVARDGGSVQEYSDAEWCDMFISWVGDKLGFTDQIGSDAWTVAHAQWFQDNDRWGDTPKPGAIVFFSWSGGKSADDIQHVGMVIKDDGDGTIQTVEGNTGNSVQVKERSTDSVVGYGYPDYAS